MTALVSLVLCGATAAAAADPQVITADTVFTRFEGQVAGALSSPPTHTIVTAGASLAIGGDYDMVSGDEGFQYGRLISGSVKIRAVSGSTAGFYEKYLRISSFASASQATPSGHFSSSSGVGGTRVTGVNFTTQDGVSYVKLPNFEHEFELSIAVHAETSCSCAFTGEDIVAATGVSVQAAVVDRALTIQMLPTPNFGVGPGRLPVENTLSYDRGYGRSLFGTFHCSYEMQKTVVGFEPDYTSFWLRPSGSDAAIYLHHAPILGLAEVQEMFSSGPRSTAFRAIASDQHGSITADSEVREHAPIEDAHSDWQTEIVVKATDPRVSEYFEDRYDPSSCGADNPSYTESVPFTFTSMDSYSVEAGQKSNFGITYRDVAGMSYEISHLTVFSGSNSGSAVYQIPPRKRIIVKAIPLVRVRYPRLLHFGESGFLGSTDEEHLTVVGFVFVPHWEDL